MRVQHLATVVEDLPGCGVGLIELLD